MTFEEELAALRKRHVESQRVHARAVAEFEVRKRRIVEIQESLKSLGFSPAEAEAEIARLDQEIQAEIESITEALAQ